MCYNPKKFYLSASAVKNIFHPYAQCRYEHMKRASDAYGEYVMIDCGKCEQCLEKKRLDWTKRIMIDVMSLDSKGFFLTLTYDARHIPVIPFGKKFRKYDTKKCNYNIYTQHLEDICESVVLGSQNEYISHTLKTGTCEIKQEVNKRWYINPAKFRYLLTYEDYEPVPEGFLMVHCKRDIDKFFKRLRINFKRQGIDLAHKLKYALVSEYGCEGERPHYHAIIYGFPKELSDLCIRDTIRASWKAGFIKLTSPSASSIRYVCKYMYSKSVVPKGCPQNIRMFSSGIGSSFDSSKFTMDEDGLQVFLPIGSHGAYKFVSLPLSCLAYAKKKTVKCPLYEAFRNKVNDVYLCAHSFGSVPSVDYLSDKDSIRKLPKYCPTMLQALTTSYFRYLSPSHLYSPLEHEKHQLEESREYEFDIRHFELAFQTGKPQMPERVRKSFGISFAQLYKLRGKCSRNLCKSIDAKLRELRHQFRQQLSKYTYEDYWCRWYTVNYSYAFSVLKPKREFASTCPF